MELLLCQPTAPQQSSASKLSLLQGAGKTGMPQKRDSLSQAAFIPVCGTCHSATLRCQVKEPKHVRAPNSSSGDFIRMINKLNFEIWKRQWQQLFPGIAPFVDHAFPP